MEKAGVSRATLNNYIGMGLIGGDVPKIMTETRIGHVTPDSPNTVPEPNSQ